MFESRLVAQSSFGDNTSGFAGVTQLVERRLLSDPIGVRVLSPAPIIPRWRNGKRSGPRPRGPLQAVGVRLSLSGPFDNLWRRAGGRGLSICSNVPGANRRPSPTTRPGITSFVRRRSDRSLSVIAPLRGGGRACGPGFDSRLACPVRGRNTSERFHFEQRRAGC